MTTNKSKITSIVVRMYRAGTGDFFILKFKSGSKVSFKMMIDCGCISGGKATFAPLIENLQEYTENEIDLLVVTHEHADHINGFEIAKEAFKDITLKKVWFAWTEDKTDDLANDLRKNHSKIKLALSAATNQLNKLKAEKYYDELFKNEVKGFDKVKGQEYFIDSINELNALNFEHGVKASEIPTMEDLLREWNVITDDTEVEFLSPGDLKKNLSGAAGIRFFVLGPPKDQIALSSVEGKKGDGYEKRESKSTIDFSFVNALVNVGNTHSASIPFDDDYILKDNSDTKKTYKAEENKWRDITYDWLYNAGGLALRFERSINNTSLVLAMQFEESERVILFPGDAEHGNWESWGDIEWTIKNDGKSRKVNTEYLLNNTVFYKVGHHMSQNGSAKEHGIEMMIHEDLAAMATLDFQKIHKLWMNTMPNDLIGSELIKRTKGKLFFIGKSEEMIENISTDRVKIKKTDLATLRKLNKAFDGKKYIDYEIQG